MEFSPAGACGFFDAAHDLQYLYRKADGIFSTVVSRWQIQVGQSAATPLLDKNNRVIRSESTSPITTLAEIHQILTEGFPNHRKTDFMNHVEQLKPLHFKIQHLKRKVERITGMISEQIAILNPLLFRYCDQTFMASLSKSDGDDDSISGKNSTEVEIEVLELMTSELKNKRGGRRKAALKNRFKTAFGKMSQKEKNVRTYEARRRQLETRLETCKGKELTQFPNFNPADFVLVWENEQDEGSSMEEKTLLAKIVQEANAKYFTSNEVDLLNDNVDLENSNTTESEIFNGPSFSLSSTNHSNALNDNYYLEVLNDFSKTSKFSDLTRNVQNEIELTISNVRMAERHFYAPDKEHMKTYTEESSLELKHFVKIIYEAGLFLDGVLSSSKRKEKIQVTAKELELMNILGNVFRSGNSCQASLELLKGLVEEAASDLEKSVVYYGGEEALDSDHPLCFDGLKLINF